MQKQSPLPSINRFNKTYNEAIVLNLAYILAWVDSHCSAIANWKLLKESFLPEYIAQSITGTTQSVSSQCIFYITTPPTK